MALLAAGAAVGLGWLAWKGRLIERVYYYSDRETTQEAVGAASVRSVLWSVPREIPDVGAGRDPGAPADAPLPPAGTAAFSSRSAIVLAVRTPAGDHDIHIRDLTRSGWSAPAPIDGGFHPVDGVLARREGLVNTPGEEITPALSPEGDAIFFASDRAAGIGGFDLYRSKRAGDAGGSWEKPVNLGPRLNSPYDDLGPAPHPSLPILVFSTTRPRSFILSPPGEWSDLILENWKAAPAELAFAVEERDGEDRRRWSTPFEIDEVGSPSADVEPCFSPSGDFLYFSSDRGGGHGGFDIQRARVREAGGPDARLRLDPPENIGRPINSAHDDRSPRLFLDGYALAYRVSPRLEKSGGLLLEARTREVESELEIASIPLRVLAQNAVRLALLAASGVLLAVLAALAFRHRRAWTPGLLARCAIVSIAVHAAALYGLAFWIVSEDIVAVAEKRTTVAETDVTVEKMLQARITLEASRLDVLVPDRLVPEAAGPASDGPSSARIDVEHMLDAPGEAAAVVLEPAAGQSSLEASSAVVPALGAADRPPVAAPEPPRSLPSAAPVPGSLPAAEAAPEVREITLAAPAGSTAARSDAAEAARPAPPAPVETAAATAVGRAPARSAVTAAATQVQAPLSDALVLPPVARSPEKLVAAVTVLPVPRQAEDVAPEAVPGGLAPGPDAGRRADSSQPTAPDTAGGSPLESPPAVRTTEAAGPLAHWRSQPLGIPPSVRPATEGEGLPEAALVPDAIAPAIAGSPVTLPESLPRAEVASTAAGEAPVLAPRAATRHAQGEGPGAGEDGGPPRGEIASPVPAPGGRPWTAPSAAGAPVTSSASVLLASEPRPGIAVLRPPEPRTTRAAVSLPEGAAEDEAGGGASEAADILFGGPRRTEKSPVRLASGTEEGRPEGTVTMAPGAVEGKAFAMAPIAPPDAAGALPRPGGSAGAFPEYGPPVHAAGSGGTLEARAARLPEAPPELKGQDDLAKVRSEGVRKVLVQRMGGSGGSEDAVRLALEWLARHQSTDGRWDVDGFDAGCRGCRSPGFQVHCDAAVTGLAVLAFLGQNHTHKQSEGPFRRTVARALDWIVKGQTPDGSFAREDARYVMYSHGIAALAVSEAYTLTRDPSLLEPLRRAVGLIVRSQNTTTGGWRYLAEPPLRGDTSVTGWQVLALVSARGAGVEVPEPVFRKARHWFDVEVAGGDHGGIYGYTRPDEPRVAMVAEGMFARQLLGGRRTDRSIEEAARYIHTETRGGSHLDNLYLLYYGNMALYHYQGWIWERWNTEVREFLIRSQHKSGRLAGSWDPRGPWSEAGGRVLSTAFAALTLEVYYRYLPLYWKADQAAGQG
jgi:hypothetical protein